MIKNDIYNIIDFENSRKRECESDYFNSKFFEMFPTKYEKLLQEYEFILFKDNVKTSFLSMDFSDDFLYDGEYSFVERIFLTLFGIIRLKDLEKSFDNFIDLKKIKKFMNWQKLQIVLMNLWIILKISIWLIIADFLKNKNNAWKVI